MIPFSVLDLSPIAEGASVADALHRSLDLAQHAERWGYRRFWLAEHHNMTGIASAATSVVIGYVAGGTKSIRVGSGGIMLPNHSPLVIAEQFGTLASLYPNRIDLGLGRAPGADPWTARALRREAGAGDQFPQDVQELQALLGPVATGQKIQAVPGGGTEVPIWLLGSSLFSAQLAATLGLPFAFASHFAPSDLHEALAIYRARFRPSPQLARPHAMVAINVFAADTDREARRQFTSVQQAFLNLRRGSPGPVPAPVDNIAEFADEYELRMVEHSLAISAVGAPATVERGLQAIVNETGADEIMLAGHFHDHAARLRSFEIAAEICPRLRVPAATERAARVPVAA